MKLERSSGILLPIAALPSPYGIGSLGKAAYDWIDFLSAAGQRWWQILPIGPTGAGDSPYQSYSTFAGNPLLVDLDLLAEDGLLTAAELDGEDWSGSARAADYERVRVHRDRLLRLAARRGAVRDVAALAEFRTAQAGWLPSYALYMAARTSFGELPWTEWPDTDLRLHRSEAVARWTEKLRDEVEYHEYVQFLFFRQWEKLRHYAKEKGIGILGDIPIYVPLDSADVWAEPRWFQLDEDNLPTAVAGCPPDYFSEDGQLWGNPLYDWDAMEKDGYGWWIRRIDCCAHRFDALRIDHFRGFESYWAIPRAAKSAKEGRWVKGPGMDLVGRLTGWFYDLQFIAEDLGLLTPEVLALLEASGLPGMKVLEFAFSPDGDSLYLPHRYEKNCICYTGTHDNAPLMAWRQEADAAELRFAEKYLGLNEREGFSQGILRGGMASAAVLFMAQMQDYLALGAESRTNVPGTPTGNWRWRLLPGEASAALAEEIAELTHRYGR